MAPWNGSFEKVSFFSASRSVMVLGRLVSFFVPIFGQDSLEAEGSILLERFFFGYGRTTDLLGRISKTLVVKPAVVSLLQTLTETFQDKGGWILRVYIFHADDSFSGSSNIILWKKLSVLFENYLGQN